MKKHLLLLILIGTLAIEASAQEQHSKRQLADRYFERYEFARAVDLYLGLAGKNNADVKVIERVADCYRLMGDQKNAEQWYATASSYTGAEAINFYYYAGALLHNNKLDKARAQYRNYYRLAGNPAALKFKLATCDSAQRWLAEPTAYKVKNEKPLNSPYSDLGMSAYGKAGHVFTSNRVTDPEGASRLRISNDNYGYYNLYQRNGDTIGRLKLNTKGNKVFNGDYHAGPMALNATGDTAWITITTTVPKKQIPVDKIERGSRQNLYTRRLQLVMATKVDGTWGNFESFAWNNIKVYSVGHAALSGDGSLLYFTSDMPGGEGGTDIWYSTKQAGDVRSKI